MTRDQKIAKARKLRGQGLTHEAIAIRLGIHRSAVTKWLNPSSKDWSQRSNSRRNAAKRQWERDNRAACPSCGAPMGAGSACPSARPEKCAECIHDEARERTEQMLALRRRGLLNYEIAERFGVTAHVVATLLQRSRVARFGFDYIPSPYGPSRAYDEQKQAA